MNEAAKTSLHSIWLLTKYIENKILRQVVLIKKKMIF